MKLWHLLTTEEKRERILRIETLRAESYKSAKRKASATASATTKRRSTAKPPIAKMTFPSEAHRALFESLPPELQRIIAG